MNLYREKDIQAITDNLDNIVKKSKIRNAKILEQTITEFNNVKKIIKDFIKSKKRVIYGGTALNELIIQKNPTDKIYGDYDFNDIEFYSPTPIEDIVDLCKILADKFKFVRAQQAQHDESYTLFVNFKAICDISYMPLNIINKMPTIIIDNIRYPIPSFILVDILRQYNDPVNSYWRLKDKTFSRANLLLKYYKLELDPTIYSPPKISNKDIITYIFNNIKNMNTLVHLGSVGINYYLNQKIELNDSLACYTVALYADAIIIYNLFLKYIASTDQIDKTKELLQIEEYSPFFQFLDHRIVFKYNNEIVFTLIGNNHICLPYHSICLNEDLSVNKEEFGDHLNKECLEIVTGKDCIKLATFILLFNYNLIMLQYYKINNNQKEAKKIEILLRILLEARNKYLTTNKLTVIDESPYQEFILGCVGKKYDYAHNYRLQLEKKRERGARTMFRFDPHVDSTPGKFIFNNSSGNKIINLKGCIIK